MDRLITAIIIMELVAVAYAGSISPYTIYARSGTANASIISISVNSSYSNTTSQQVIYSAESYLADRLGQSYYNSHVSYYGAESYGNSSYVYFTYSVPFSNGTSAMGVLDMQSPSSRLLGITMSMNGTRVKGYIGPAKPYFVEISPTDAINISETYGIQDGNATIDGVFGASNLSSNSTYSIAWAVIGGSPLKSGIYQGVYINAESGNVMGEYSYNPLVAQTQPGSAYSYGTAGNYSSFYMANQTSTTSTSNPVDSQYILPLIIVAFVMLGLGMYLSRRER